MSDACVIVLPLHRYINFHYLRVELYFPCISCVCACVRNRDVLDFSIVACSVLAFKSILFSFVGCKCRFVAFRHVLMLRRQQDAPT